MASFFRRLLVAAAIYGLMFSILAALHDYPQLRQQMHKVRTHDPIAGQRQWLTLFYLINEAGSGLKFLLSGDERHMAHFPSPSHIFAARQARAENGEFAMQLEVARMHHLGEWAPQDAAAAKRWLRRARDNAPTPAQTRQAAQLLEWVEAQSPAEAH